MKKGFFSVFNCKNSTIQGYECQVCIKPRYETNKEWVCVDACLASEILYLWSLGIETTGCCCGKHSDDYEGISYIGVKDEFIQRMKEMGYNVRFNPCRPNDDDSFIPKTNFDERTSK